MGMITLSWKSLGELMGMPQPGRAYSQHLNSIISPSSLPQVKSHSTRLHSTSLNRCGLSKLCCILQSWAEGLHTSCLQHHLPKRSLDPWTQTHVLSPVPWRTKPMIIRYHRSSDMPRFYTGSQLPSLNTHQKKKKKSHKDYSRAGALWGPICKSMAALAHLIRVCPHSLAFREQAVQIQVTINVKQITLNLRGEQEAANTEVSPSLLVRQESLPSSTKWGSSLTNGLWPPGCSVTGEWPT